MKMCYDDGKNEVFLSIIVPVYNVSDYLGTCLKSCVEQCNTDRNGVEIICVNDGSTDKSLDIIREYSNSYTNVRLIDKQNGGVASARNAGIREAKGKYVWFVDGDDWIANDSVKAITNQINSVSVQPDMILFSHQNVKGYENRFVSLTKNGKLFGGGYATLEDNYSNSVWCRWFKLSFLMRNNLSFDTHMKYAEDTLFLANARIKSESTLLFDEVCYYYLQRESSAMHKIDAQSHAYSMLRLAVEYFYYKKTLSDKQISKRMENAYLRAMQAFYRDLSLYCGNRDFVRAAMKLTKKYNLYPFGVDWKQFRRDRRQSIKNDIMNWFFGLISFEPYFWMCWAVCGCAWSNYRKDQQFNISVFQKLIEDNIERLL